MKKSMRYSSGGRDRAVRLVREGIKEHCSEWSAIVSIADKTGCPPEALRKWLCRKRTEWGARIGTEIVLRWRVRQDSGREFRVWFTRAVGGKFESRG